MDFEYINKEAKNSMTATEQDSIKNSIEMIASTPYASAPFIRSMGIKNYPPENNSELSKNQYATEVITQVGIWEDRVQLSEVRFYENNKVRMVLSNG